VQIIIAFPVCLPFQDFVPCVSRSIKLSTCFQMHVCVCVCGEEEQLAKTPLHKVDRPTRHAGSLSHCQNGRLARLSVSLPISFWGAPLHEADRLLPLPEHWAETPSERGTKKKNLSVHHHCTNNKQPLTPPDTHVTSIYRTTWLNMHLMGDLG